MPRTISKRFHMCSVEVTNMLFRTFCTPMYTCQYVTQDIKTSHLDHKMVWYIIAFLEQACV